MRLRQRRSAEWIANGPGQSLPCVWTRRTNCERFVSDEQPMRKFVTDRFTGNPLKCAHCIAYCNTLSFPTGSICFPSSSANTPSSPPTQPFFFLLSTRPHALWLCKCVRPEDYLVLLYKDPSPSSSSSPPVVHIYYKCII